jgi:O-antigen/teichoic acid export membrane protein
MPPWIFQWLRDSRLLVFAEVLVVLMSTLIAILLARNLGPSSWGLFSALLGLALAFSIFVEAGLGTWLLRELSRLHQDQTDPDLRRLESAPRVMGGMLGTVVTGVPLLVCAVLIASLFGVSAGTVAALAGLVLSVITLCASSCLGAFLRAERELKKLVAGMMLERGVLLASVAVVLQVTQAVWAIALLYVIAGALRLSYLAFVVFYVERVPIVVPGLAHIRNFILSGMPFAFNSVALIAIPKLDTFIISIGSTTAAGYFALGDRIISPAIFLPVVASTALYPYLARERDGSRAAWKITVVMLLLGCLATLIGVILAPWAVPTVFGESYEGAVVPVQLMLMALPFVYASNVLVVHLYTLGRERRMLVGVLLASIIGTLCLIVGFVLADASGAAAGYVTRQVLFTVTLGTLALLPGPHIASHSGAAAVEKVQ